MVWFAACVKCDSASYYNEKELKKRTEIIIADMPKRLRNPFGGNDQHRLSQFFHRLGASADSFPMASVLCSAHKGLSGQLVASARSLLEFAAEDLLCDLKDILGPRPFLQASKETRCLVNQAENTMAFSIPGPEFEATYNRQVPSYLAPEITICDACYLQQVISTPDMLCGLRGVVCAAKAAGLDTDPRLLSCKLFLESCIAAYSQFDAVLLCKISDKMTEELSKRNMTKRSGRTGFSNSRPNRAEKNGQAQAQSMADRSHNHDSPLHRAAVPFISDEHSDMTPAPLNITKGTVKTPAPLDIPKGTTKRSMSATASKRPLRSIDGNSRLNQKQSSHAHDKAASGAENGQGELSEWNKLYAAGRLPWPA